MRVGIIGVGTIAKIHLQALLKEGHDVVALCDVDRQKCDAANDAFGLCATIYTDHLLMLDQVKPDAVHICTPHHLHASMCCAALQRNIHVLCEKPLAISLSQLEELRAAVAASDAQLGVCHQNRFLPTIRYAYSLFAESPVESATATVHWKRDRAYYDSATWRGKWETEGGGVMINQALHSLDLLQWFCGFPETVKATVANHSLEAVIEVEDTAFGLFSLKNGGRFLIHATNAASHSFPVDLSFFGNGTTVQICRDCVIVNGKPISTEQAPMLTGKAEWGNGHLLLFREFYRCLEAHEPFCLDFEEASKVVRLILAMYRSNGNEITL